MMRLVMIVIIGLVMAMVMFGRNPIKEMQQQELARRAKYGADPLTRETNMYIEQKQNEGRFSGLSTPKNTQVAPPDDGTPEPEDGTLVKQNDSTTTAEPAGNNLPTPSTANSGSYYPPIVDSVSGSQKPLSISSMNKLRSGQPIAFDGMEVFAIDSAGKRTLLPDGNYTLYDGSKIEILGGRRVTVPDTTK